MPNTPLTQIAHLKGTTDASGNLNTNATVTVADGADAVEGTTTDVAVTGDNSGTISAKLRGLSKILADVWSSGSHWLLVGQGGAPWDVEGDIASGSADSGKPVKQGFVAKTSLPTATSDGNRINGLADIYGRQFVRHGSQGLAGAYTHNNHAPSANTKATITKSSAGAGVRNVCTGFTISLSAGSTAPAAVQLTVALIDGGTGGTTYLWGPTTVSLPATAGATAAFICGQCWKPGTANTAMTLEFSAAGGANTVETVEFDSTTVAE